MIGYNHNKQLKNYLVIIQLQMNQCMGARNTRGFSSAVSAGRLPEVTHLTYEGIFNEIKFDVGLKTDKIVDVHLGYARYQFAKSKVDGEINDYMAVFLKSSRDGADRDERTINSLICLDISGSMDSNLGGNNKKSLSRLKLSVQAIKMFISKLRPNDSIGLVTFDTEGYVIFKPVFKSHFDNKNYDLLDQIVDGGGTTIKSGFILSKKLLSEFIKENQCVNCQNRIIMLTDVGDNSLQHQKELIEMASVEDGINMTVVGISTDFRSQVCQKLKNVKGFNYFCAVNKEDIKKYVFETFDFGFFPSAYDLNIGISSQDIVKFQVFGAPDSEEVASYNDYFKKQQTCYTISKMKSTFPSEIQIHHDKIYTIGGLVLIKLKRKTDDPFFKGHIILSYKCPSAKFSQQTIEFCYQFHPKQQFYSHQCLRSAIEGFIFTNEMRQLLKASKQMKYKQIYISYWDLLKDLQQIVPEFKLKDFNNVKTIIQSYGKQKKQEIEQKYDNLSYI